MRGTNPNSLANLKKIKPGQVMNPTGKRSAGSSVKEWINALSQQDLRVDDLRKLAKREPIWNRRMAALHMLRAIENPDIADFEPVLLGKMDLRTLRRRGIDTTCVKKTKAKERIIPQKEGEPIHEIDREIELHDRSGGAFDRIMDRTDGLPTQGVKIQGVIAHVRTFAYAGGNIPPHIAQRIVDLERGGGGPALHDGQGSADRGTGGDRKEPGGAG